MLLQRLCSFVRGHKNIAGEQSATVGTDVDGTAMQGDGGSAVLRTALPPFLNSSTILLPTGKNPTLNHLKLNRKIMAKSKKKDIKYYIGFAGSTTTPSHCYSGIMDLNELYAKHKYINWQEIDESTYYSVEETFSPNITLTVLD